MNLIDRVKNILLTPKTEWPVVAAEPDSIGGIYTKYLVYLAAIPALCLFLSTWMYGMGALGFRIKVGFFSALASGVLTFLMLLAMTYVLAMIVNALAPTFDGEKNHVNAFKLVAYSYTPAMVAALFLLVPWFGFMSFFGSIYSLVLLYKGLPVMMKNPESKNLPYFLVMMICGMIAGIFMAVITSCLTPSASRSMMGGGDDGAVTISTPVGKVEVQSGKGKDGDGSVSINTPMGKVDVQSSGKAKDGDGNVSINTPVGKVEVQSKSNDKDGAITIKGPGGTEVKVETQTNKDGSVTINAPGAKIELDAKKLEDLAKKFETLGKKMDESGKSGEAAAALKALSEALGKPGEPKK